MGFSDTSLTATTIPSVVATLRQSTSSNRELAVAIHDYVRDAVRFGFTKRHDTADAAYTLRRQVGHCTPKTELFCALLRHAGFQDATIVTVPIPGQVLRFLGPKDSSPFPNRLQHCFTEVTVDGILCRVDSYVVDTSLYDGVRSKLIQRNKDNNDISEEMEAGFGIHLAGTTQWNGDGDAFIQYVESMHTPELETRFSSHKDVVESSGYLHSELMSVLSTPILGWFVGRVLEGSNGPMDTLRAAS